jgi:acyl carrier protein
MALTRDDVLTQLREVGAEILGVEPDAITETARFKEDLEADSLDLVEVVMALEERLEIAIPEEDLEDVATVGQAIDVVLGRVAATA